MPEQVIVHTDELIDILKANRDKHRTAFLAAQKGYRRKAVEILDQTLADAKAGRHFEMAFRLPVPEDHTSDYDREIRMLELHTEDKVTLDQSDAEQYVMDNWNWSRAFAATAAAYGVR